jgi:hypothetical protein
VIQGVRFVFHGTGRYWLLMFYPQIVRTFHFEDKANFSFLSVLHRIVPILRACNNERKSNTLLSLLVAYHSFSTVPVVLVNHELIRY